MKKVIQQNWTMKNIYISDIYQKRNWNKEIRTEIKTIISRLIDVLYSLNDIISR